MSATLTRLSESRIVAIIRLEEYSKAREVARALVAGGITALEFTLTGKGVYEAIEKVRADLGDQAVVGIGTVLQPSEVADAASAGAQFVVTPILKPAVITACKAAALPIICGAFTPTEIYTAYEAGAEMIKVFPARSLGPQYIRDVLAPLPDLKLVPTGGVSKENARAYLDAGAIALGIGGNLISPRAVSENDWAMITAEARACKEAVR